MPKQVQGWRGTVPQRWHWREGPCKRSHYFDMDFYLMKERLEERDMEIQRTATENNEADSQTGLMDCGMDLPVMLLAALPMAVGQWGGDRNTAYRHWKLDWDWMP